MRKSKVHSIGELGLGRLTVLFFGTLIGAAVYVAGNVFPFFYSYLEIQNQTRSLISVANENTDEELRQKLWYHVKKLDIPIEKQEIIIIRRGGEISISFDYSETFWFTWEDEDHEIKTFDFSVFEDGPV